MSRLSIPFPAIYPMRHSKRPFLLFHSPQLTQCTHPNLPFINPIPSCLPNAPIQTSRLAIPFPAIYPMRPSKRPVYLSHSPLLTQCAPPNVRFTYSIPRYLPNAPLHTSRLDIPFPSIYSMLPLKVPFNYYIPRYLPNAPTKLLV